MFDLNATASQFVFRGNSVVSGRRFGVLAKGQRLAIESNSFIGLGSGAVNYLNPDTEGLCARSAVFSRNTVGRNGQSTVARRSTPNGALWADALPKVTVGLVRWFVPPICHSRITCSTGPHPVLEVYDDGALLDDNRIIRADAGPT